MISFEPCAGCESKEAVVDSAQRLCEIARVALEKTGEQLDAVTVKQERIGTIGAERSDELDFRAMWAADAALTAHRTAQKVGAVIDRGLLDAGKIVVQEACVPDAECIPNNIIIKAGSEACRFVDQYTGSQTA